MIVKRYFNKYASFFYTALFFALICGIQLLGKNNDWYGYINIFSFNGARNNTEFGFRVIRKINDIVFLSSVGTIYFFIGFICLIIKINVFNKLFDDRISLIYSTVFYFLTFFWIHEYTQIRVALSIGIFWTSLLDLQKHKNFPFLLKALIATLFHYSGIVVFVFFVFQKIIDTPRKCKSIVIFGFFLAFFVNYFAGNYLASLRSVIYFLQNKVGLNKSGGVYNFSLFNLKYLSFLFMFIYFGKYASTTRISIILYQSIAFGLCFFYYLNPIRLPVISIRFTEYFTSVFVIYFANILSFKKINIIEKSSIILFILFYSFATLRTTGIIS